MRNIYLYLIVFFQILQCYGSNKESINLNGDFGVIEQFIGSKLNHSFIHNNRDIKMEKLEISLIEDSNTLFIYYSKYNDKKNLYFKIRKTNNPNFFNVETNFEDYESSYAELEKYGTISITSIKTGDRIRYGIVGNSLAQLIYLKKYGSDVVYHKYLLDPKITTYTKLKEQNLMIGELINSNSDFKIGFDGQKKFRFIGLKNSRIKIETASDVNCIIALYDSKGSKIKTIEGYKLDIILPTDDMYFISISMNYGESIFDGVKDKKYTKGNHIQIFAEYE